VFGLDALLEPLPQAHPSEVVGQVLGRHAAQLAVDPGLETLVVVVDRLDVIDALADATVVAHRYRLGRDAQLGGCGPPRAATVGAQQRVWSDHGPQGVLGLASGHRRQHTVGDLVLAPHAADEHRHEVARRPLWRGLAPSGTRGARHLAAPLLRLPEVGLVGLQQAGDLVRLVGLNGLEEAVPQAERRAHGYAKGGSGLTHGQALGETLALLEEAPFAVKPGQRRAGGGVEGLAAGAAAVALEPPAVTVLDDLAAGAVGALRGTPGGLQDAQRLGLGPSPLDRQHQLVELGFRQGRDLRKQGLERLHLHGQLLL
jgi:hypothetical protein